MREIKFRGRIFNGHRKGQWDLRVLSKVQSMPDGNI